MKLGILEYKDQVLAGGNIETSVMGINADKISIAAYYLRDKIYSNKPLAVIREYICNALDEHLTHNIDREVDAGLEAENGKYYFFVRDYAKGLDDNGVRNIFGCMFESTKSDSDLQTGGFGIGSKAAHAYTDTFEIHSHYNGTVTYYICSLESDPNSPVPLGKIRNLGSAPTTETGVLIRVPVDNDDFYKFQSELNMFVDRLDPSVKIKLNNSLSTVEQYNLFEYKGIKLHHINRETGNRVSIYNSPVAGIRMGWITYPVPPEMELDEAFRDYIYSISPTMYYYFTGHIIVEVPVGTFKVALSRENIEIPKDASILNNFKNEILESLIAYRDESTKNVVVDVKDIRNRLSIIKNGWFIDDSAILGLKKDTMSISKVISKECNKEEDVSSIVAIMIPENSSNKRWKERAIEVINKLPNDVIGIIINVSGYEYFNRVKAEFENNIAFTKPIEIYSCKDFKSLAKQYGLNLPSDVSKGKKTKSPADRKFYVKLPGMWGKHMLSANELYKEHYNETIPELSSLTSVEDVYKYCVSGPSKQFNDPDCLFTSSNTLREELLKLGFYSVNDPQVKRRVDELESVKKIEHKRANSVNRYISGIQNIYKPKDAIVTIVSKNYEPTEERANRISNRVSAVENTLRAISKEKSVRGEILGRILESNSIWHTPLQRDTLRRILTLK